MKIRLFIENFLVYGMGGIAGKLIPLIMIPIITRILPNSTYFGINDNTTSLVSIMTYLSLMGMYDAMYRMFFDREDIDYRKKICSTTFVYTFSLSTIICILAIAFKESLARLFYGEASLAYLVYIAAITTLVSATNTIVSGPARMQNKRLIYVCMNTIVPLISYLLALTMMKKGMYTTALPIAVMLAGVVKETVFVVYNRDWFSFKYVDLEILKPMLKFAIPLIPNFLIYWVFNSCDRLMITQMLGIAEAGVYGIGAKLGSASQLIYTAFAGGWQYFAYSTMNDKNQVRDNSLLFEYLGSVSMICTAFICTISFSLYSILFPADYLGGFIIAPYLFLAPLCQMLFQVAISQFTIIKKTWPNMLFLFGGAIINVILNFILIPFIGIEGASIATLLGFVVSTILCVTMLRKIKLFIVTKRFIISICSFILYFALWRVVGASNVYICVLFILLLVDYYILYKKELSFISKKIEYFTLKRL